MSAEHRVAMCQLACKSSEFVMTDPWEVSLSLSLLQQKKQPKNLPSYLLHFTPVPQLIQTKLPSSYQLILLKIIVQASQDSYQRTLTVLSRIKSALCDGSLASSGKVHY